ncbi:MAG: AsmA-like C-terminal region-containing protein [Pirellulaceae bacterium]|nr:AsmA-like C-terminal region-containing protein [Pirellulaceae bacterium]
MDAGANKKTEQHLADWQAIKLRERDRVWEHRFVWLLLLTLVSLGTYHYLHSRVDTTLRNTVLKLIAARFPNHLVALDSAHLEPGRGVLLEGLAIALPTSDGPRVIVRVPRLIARGDIQLLGLIQRDIPIERVYLDAVDLTLWPLPDGRTSLETLSSSSIIPKDLPPIDIKRGLIRIGGITGSYNDEMIFHDFNVSIRSNQSQKSIVRANLPTLGDSSPEFSLNADSHESSAGIVATLRSSFFSKLQVDVTLSHDKQEWNVRGNVDKLFYTPQWTERLPTDWKRYLVQLSGFSGNVTAEFEIAKQRDQAPDFSFLGQIENGRLQHPILPYPLEELAGRLQYRNERIELRNATARSGDARFQLESDVYGLALGSPMVAHLKAKNLPLDERLLRALPPSIQEQWIKMNPAGSVDTELTLTYDGKSWTPEGVVHARNGFVNADIFPFPLTNVCGDFYYRDGILVSEAMTAMANGKVIRGIIRLARASPKWLVDFTVSSDDPVPIDDKLIEALTPRGQPSNALQTFVRSLSATGAIHLENCRFVRNADDIHSVSKSLELGFYGGTLKYSGFRYPIADVQGHISVNNQSIRLQRMKGRNDSARIQCDGQMECDGFRVVDMELAFDVQNLSLDEELHASLPVAVRKLWSHLRPSGVVDHVDVHLAQHGINSPLELVVGLQEDGRDQAESGRSVSMLPQSLPYLLNNVACDLSYRPGFVEIRKFGASHDLSRLKAEGEFNVNSDGTWNGILSWLPTTRLSVDQNLLVSLPEYIRSPLMATEFRGPMGITGQTLVASNRESGEPTVQAWDIEVEIEDGQLAGGKLASGIRGSLHVLGENTRNGPVAKGYMTMDSMAVRGIPVTKLTGPFAVSDSKLVVGRQARFIEVAPLAARLAANRRASDVVLASAMLPSQLSTLSNTDIPKSMGVTPTELAPWNPASGGMMLEREASRELQTNRSIRHFRSTDIPILDVREDDLKAKTMSGTLFVHGTHPLIEGQTELKLALSDADLVGFLADMGESHNKVSGHLWIEGRLEGSLMHTNTLSGSGNAWLREANFYHMPVMTHMFRALSVKPPDDGAFESADVQFRVDGDRVPIDKISLDGDIISLRGNGWVNLRREIQLDLYAYVGNRSPMAAIFGPLISQNDSATMLQLEVTGTTDNLQFRKNIPLMSTSLQQIFPDRVDSPK